MKGTPTFDAVESNALVVISSLDFSQPGAAQARQRAFMGRLARYWPAATLVNLQITPPEIEGVTVISRPRLLARLPWRLSVIILLLPVLVRLLLGRRAKIICFDRDIQVLATAVVAARLFRAELVHEITEYPSEVVAANLINRLGTSIFENVLLPNIDFVMVISRALMDYVKKLSPSARILLVPPIAEGAQFAARERADTGEVKYVYTGSFIERKDGVLSLIRAFSLLAANRPNARLHLYGQGPPLSHSLLRHEIDTAGLGSLVTIHAAIPQQQVPSVLSNSDVLVLCRPFSRQAEGGFSTKLIEYLASGCPVVSTVTGDIGRFLEDNVSAFLAPPNDVRAFASRMCAAGYERAAGDQIGRNGRAVFLQYFDADLVVERVNAWLRLGRNTSAEP